MNETITLTEPIEMDVLVKMIKMAFAFDNWEKVLTLSSKLLEATNLILLNESKHLTKLDRHIAYYYGYSYLMQGLAFKKFEEHNKSFECINSYSELDWLDDESEECKIIINDFKTFAKANSLTLEISLGNRDKIKEYVEFLEENPDEILTGLITILESALSFSFSVDEELAHLMHYIKESSQYVEQVVASKYLSFNYLLACYKYKQSNYSEAADLILHTLIQSDVLNNDSYFKKSVALFEALKPNVSGMQLEEYSIILNRIFKGANEYEKSTYHDSLFVNSAKQ